MALPAGSNLTTSGPPEYQRRFDYAGREDMQVVYIGWARQTKEEASEEWTIEKYTYDTNGIVTKTQISRGSWNNRTTLTYA